MPQNKPWLVISESGRALAASAARAGLETMVIDRFADADTFAVTTQALKLPGSLSGFDMPELLKALQAYSKTDFSGVVVGSGLEAHPDILDYIDTRWAYCGNPAATVRKCKDSSIFFRALAHLKIAHPRTYTGMAPDAGNWLLKRTGFAGGHHVRRYEQGESIPDGCYLQQEITGGTYSAVFLADGVRSVIAGINRIYAANPAQGDYRYSAAVTLNDDVLQAAFREIVTELTSQFALKGLCGVDAIMSGGGELLVLEVNPRPTATFELHEHNDSLFMQHIRACAGKLPAIVPQTGRRSCGHRIVYADNSFTLPEFSWPEWATDRPVTGRLIDVGAPVCTVHGVADTPEHVLRLLEERTDQIENIVDQHRLAA